MRELTNVRALEGERKRRNGKKGIEKRTGTLMKSSILCRDEFGEWSKGIAEA